MSLRVELLGLPIALVTYEDVVWNVSAHLLSPSPATVAIDATNTMGLAKSRVDPLLSEAMAAYDVLLPDGMPLVWCLRAKGHPLPDRVYGPYVIEHVLRTLPRPTRIAVIGGRADMHTRLRSEAALRFPLADFVHFDSTNFDLVDAQQSVASLLETREQGAEIVFICLGVPKQYLWVKNARPHADGQILLSVGGAFDFILGKKKYAPDWMQRHGLTWLFRALQEPRRLAKRYLKYNLLFLWLILRHEVVPGKLSVARLMRAVAGYPRGPANT